MGGKYGSCVLWELGYSAPSVALDTWAIIDSRVAGPVGIKVRDQGQRPRQTGRKK